MLGESEQTKSSAGWQGKAARWPPHCFPWGYAGKGSSRSGAEGRLFQPVAIRFLA